MISIIVKLCYQINFEINVTSMAMPSVNHPTLKSTVSKPRAINMIICKEDNKENNSRFAHNLQKAL